MDREEKAYEQVVKELQKAKCTVGCSISESLLDLLVFVGEGIFTHPGTSKHLLSHWSSQEKARKHLFNAAIIKMGDIIQ